MATTQYIGARYVPLFFTNPDDSSNNWKSGVAYDPLTIVTDLNQSYTSKIPVPATVGRPSENPTYWIMTGAYSAQVEQYRQEVEEVRSDVEDLQQDLADTNTEVSRLRDHKYIFISDSYGAAENGFIERIEDICGLTRGTNSFKYTQGGYGFSSVQGKFITLLQTAAGAITDPESITDIVVIGGTNDCFGTGEIIPATTITSDISSFCSAAKTAFPNALVSIGFVAGSKTASLIGSYMRVRNAYSSGARLAENAVYIESSEYILVDNRYISSDNTHPTSAGYGRIAEYISEYIKGGEIYVSGPKETLSDSGTGFAINYEQLNNVLILQPNSNTLTLSAVDIYTGNARGITSTTLVPFISSSGNWIMHGNALIVDRNDVSHLVACDLRVTDSYIQYRPIFTDGPYSQCKSITFYFGKTAISAIDT